MQMDTRYRLAILSPFQVPKLLFARLVGRRFGLATYQINHLYLADALLSLGGKRVLEVGGSLPKGMVIDHYKCKRWVCVDDRQEYVRELNLPSAAKQAESGGTEDDHEESWSYFEGRIQDIPAFFEGQFDIVYSTAVLEHVSDLPDALRKMKTALAPGGRMFHSIGPIWSGPKGYHIFPTYFPEHGESAGLRVVAELRPWMHLAMTPDQMHEHMHVAVGDALAETAVYSIYQSPRLNRLIFDDYFKIFEAANLEPLWVKRWIKKQTDTHFLEQLHKPDGDREKYLFDTFSTVLAQND